MTIKDFLRAVLAGGCISIGCIVYLAVENKVAGALLFSVGLLSILQYKLNLYTGKIGLAHTPKEVLVCVGYLLGNMAGCGITYGLLSVTPGLAKIAGTLGKVAGAKLALNPLQLVILGIFCGILMLFATKKKDSALVTVLCVAVFILAGFEHSVADAFYLMAQCDPLTYLTTIAWIALGNGIGAIGINAILD